MISIVYRALKTQFNKGVTGLRWKIKNRITDPIKYQNWILKNEADKLTLANQQMTSKKLPYRPLISIVTPLYNTPKDILNAMIESVVEQTYDNWQLCIANGNPESKDICKTLHEYAEKDQRIKIVHLKQNLGIAGNTNTAIGLATGDFVGFLDHDDRLAPSAIFEVVLSLQQYADADLIYSDEDKLTFNGKKRFEPHFKPAYSPDLLRSMNYISHFLVVRKTLGHQIGWLRNGFEGAQDYDLTLRIVEQARIILHIPKVLYHWRQWASSSTNTPDTSPAKKLANEVGKKALRQHLERCGVKSTVEDGPSPTMYQVRYSILDNPLVSIIILNRDHAEDLRQCLLSIQSISTYHNYEIILVENSSQEKKTFLLYEELRKDPSIRIINYKESFNFSKANNYAIRQALGDVFLFLNNDIEVLSQDWLERMLEHALRKEVAIVGPKLYYPNDTIQHAGVILGIGEFAGHSHKYFPKNAMGYMNHLRLIQNYSAVTGACMMIRREVFRELGGFDEQYALAASDIDLCLKALSNDYLIVWTPYSELYHHESKTRGNENTKQKRARFDGEIARFRQKWSTELERGDDYYNPNLTLSSENFSINPNLVNASPRIKPGFTKSDK